MFSFTHFSFGYVAVINSQGKDGHLGYKQMNLNFKVYHINN